MDESVIKHLEQQQVGTLKLSEAIRIGAQMRRQCRGLLFDGARSCAIGAAMEARGGNLRSIMGTDSIAFRGLVRKLVPELDGSPLWEAIGERNDSGMSREEIADWLEAQGY